jgi:ATP-dependent RNA helicase DDX23/PRP28
MTTRDWRIFREDHNIATKGGSIPNPIRNWEESGMPSWLLKGIADLNFKSPSPIQMQAIPAGLQKRDVMGTAETGSGKTAAFALPILVHLSKLPQTTGDDGPYAVIMAPTRELAVQIEDKIVDFAKYSPITIRTACLIGGDPIDTQAFHLSKGVEIVVGTPGRINECIEKQMLILTSCHFVVLDEADVMIDMNFEPQILSVLDAIPANSSRKKREDGTPVEPEIHSDYELITVMFSATMPPSIERLARSYLRKPAYVHIGEIGVAVDRIKQNVVFCKNETDKRRKLEELISATAPPVIVFVNQKSTCESIMKFLTQAGHKATSLHSNKNLDSRLYSLDSFKEGQFQVLVATDVARRGLDVPNVQHVINYEMPQKITDYTHRIGRTGRAGQTGLATSLVTNADSHILYDLKQMLQKSPNNTVPQELRDHPAAQFKADGGAKMKDIV